MPDQGDIVLVPVPFTDLSVQKRRPFVVISNNDYHRQTADFVGVALTSQPQSTPYGFTITSANLASGTLKRQSQVRVDKVYTLAQAIITQRFGKVSELVLDRIRSVFVELVRAVP
jgi:mRNA interferase MazF